MVNLRSLLLRAVPLLVVAAAGFALDVSDAYAQSASCQQLQRQLQSLERNRDFRSGSNNASQAKQVAAQVQKDESTYIRSGCNDLAKKGAQLPRECRTLASRILKGRAQVEQLQQSVDTAGAVAQQREAILQEIARFGCNSNSRADVNSQDRPRRKTLFEQLFGGYTEDEQPFTDGEVIGEDFGYSGYGTVRTVCVRKTDGYFWPISYSTVQDYVGQDAAQCSASCPGAPVELFYYSNPGQEPEEMVSMAGESYASQSYAFAYRQKFDDQSKCTVASPGGGSITVITDDAGRSVAMITVNDQTFPMPRRDPRGATAPAPAQVAAIATVDIPLPRPRPRQAGEVGPLQTAKPASPVENKVVTIAGKTVRIVGPDTPYARLGEAGT